VSLIYSDGPTSGVVAARSIAASLAEDAGLVVVGAAQFAVRWERPRMQDRSDAVDTHP
jgi:hypothetical protein